MVSFFGVAFVYRLMLFLQFANNILQRLFVLTALFLPYLQRGNLRA